MTELATNFTRTCVSKTCRGPEHEATAGLLCKPALLRLTRTIGEMPALFDWLSANLAPGSASTDAPVSGSRERPLPISSSVHDQAELIRQTLNGWARCVAEERDLTGPWRPLNPHSLAERDRLQRGVEMTCTVNALATFLLAHLDWAASQPWIDDLDEEMRDLARDGHAIAPTKPGRHDLPAPCPDCQTRALARWDGEDHVICRHCHAMWSEETYARLVRVLALEAS